MTQAGTGGDPGPWPQVFVVDGQVPVAPVVPVPSRVPPRLGRQHLFTLYLLVGLALLGLTIEAGFIYQLHHRAPGTQVSPDTHETAQRIGEKKHMASDDSNEIPLILAKTTDKIKPAAFLQGGGSPVAGQNGVMLWQTEGLSPFLRDLRYGDGSLHFQIEGFYYIYSKVYYSETCSLFKHQVKRRSPRYSYAPTNLMQSIRYSCVELEEVERADVGNSYLGGVFHLYKNDSVYVEVNNSSLLKPGVYDNFFGVFMV